MEKIEIIAPRNFSDFERADYQRLKSQAKQGWLMFAEAIKEIHSRKLYRLEYGTFEEFCESELGITRKRAYEFLAASDVMQTLQMSPIGDILPQTESQARPLAKLEHEAQVIAWEQVVSTTPPEQITAAKVEQVVNELKPLNSEIKAEKQSIEAKINKEAIMISEKEREALLKREYEQIKQRKAQEFLQKREEKLQQATQTPIPDYELQLIERCKKGETVVVNLNKHLHVVKWAKDNGKFQQIDRYSEFGNPFYLGSDGDRDFVCDSYKIYLDRKLGLHSKVMQLKGKILGCHCHPDRCHGDEIVNFINGNSHE